jgi:phosphoribosylamine--glycine ligase
MTIEDAEDAVSDCFSGAFGESGSIVVIEDYMQGEEASVFALCDGETVTLLPSCQDHKRVWDGDHGPNTGGMGAYSPAPVMDAALTARVRDEIILPAIQRMAERGTPFTGVLYAGIMVTAEGPRLVEFNVRFGDPECQVLMPRLESDLLELMLACAEGRLGEAERPRFSDRVALTVVMAANGYPGTPETGGAIEGLDAAEAAGAIVFQAGTRERDGRLVAAGGRVLAVTAEGPTVRWAQKAAYTAVDRIDFPTGFCRRDIGWREIERETKGRVEA